MYDFNKSDMTPIRESIFRGHWIIFLTLLFICTVLITRITQEKIVKAVIPSPVRIAKHAAPIITDQVTPTVLHNQIVSTEPSLNFNTASMWFEWINDAFMVIEPAVRYIFEIPNRHYEEVARHHHYKGFLPTLSEDGNIVQKTPCITVNFIYSDGRVDKVCKQGIMTYD